MKKRVFFRFYFWESRFWTFINVHFSFPENRLKKNKNIEIKNNK